MKAWLYCMAVLMVVIAHAPVVPADIALPPENKNTNTTPAKARVDRLPLREMVIERKKLETPEVRLQIPQSMLKQLNAAGLTDGAPNQTAAVSSRRPFQTIVAGLFMSLSVAFAGLWLIRSRRSPANRLAVGLILTLAATGLLSVIVYANIRPPVRYGDPGTLPRAVSGEALSGMVRVEVVAEGNNIKLILPPQP